MCPLFILLAANCIHFCGGTDFQWLKRTSLWEKCKFFIFFCIEKCLSFHWREFQSEEIRYNFFIWKWSAWSFKTFKNLTFRLERYYQVFEVVIHNDFYETRGFKSACCRPIRSSHQLIDLQPKNSQASQMGHQRFPNFLSSSDFNFSSKS